MGWVKGKREGSKGRSRTGAMSGAKAVGMGAMTSDRDGVGLQKPHPKLFFLEYAI